MTTLKDLLKRETDLDTLRAAKATWLAARAQATPPPEPPPSPSPPPPAPPRYALPADGSIPWDLLDLVNQRWASLPDDYYGLRQILRQLAAEGRWTFDQDRVRLASTEELITLILSIEFSPELVRLYFAHYE